MVTLMNKPIGENEVLLSGIAATDALPAHSSRGRNYFGFVLEVCRLSGATDRLNIIIPEDKLPPSGIHAGDSLTISGQIRSFNNKSGQGSRLVISVYVMSIADGGGEHENTCLLYTSGDNAYIYAALVYVLAEVTDCLDGYIARKFHKITRLGRVLDPLADKLMAFTVLVCIVIESRVPVWAALLFFIKEMCIRDSYKLYFN